MSSSNFFLNVEQSLSGKCWLARDVDERLALALSQRLGVAEIVGRVLAGRGVGLEDAQSFLNPTLKDFLPDPAHLRDMDTACERLVRAIEKGEHIVIFGDYDVDGATSSALLARYLRTVGAQVGIYIPDRIKEGYGPNTPALLKLADEGAKVVITVDCGTLAFESLGEARQAGLDVIVVDHHAAEPTLPEAVAVINPNRLDDDSPHGQMAAVGVAFLLAVGLNRALRDVGWFADRREPDLRQWLDIVALGTVCDVVPLVGVNRALVAQGLKIMAGRTNVGLRALADVAGMDEAPGAYHAGYVLGPRINAGGRVGASELGARLLSTDNAVEAEDIAKRLDGYNRERQQIEAQVQEEAFAKIEASNKAAAPVIVVAGEGWHPGVIGIVASRIKERFNRPACVVALHDGVGTASGRSVRGVDLGAAVIAARQKGILQKGGGHAMAAGFTLDAEQLDALEIFFAERLASVVEEATARPSIRFDGALSASGVNTFVVTAIQDAGPFGVGNPEPRFVVADAKLVKVDVVGRDQTHVRALIDTNGKRALAAIAFGAMETALGPALLKHGGKPFHLAGRLRLNTYNGFTSPQLLLEDAAPVW